MDLILWRHAEAEDSAPDAQRKLTAKGRKQAKAMAAWLEPRLSEPWKLLASPLVRAQETASALSGRFATVAEIANATRVESLLEAAEWPDCEGISIVVGHQPMLGRVAARLLCDANAECGVKKGAIWWFRRRGNGAVLLAVITPELLKGER
ncbi:MAG: SixA phosphatase family protein [Burkholderiales bacterium]